MRSVGEWFSEYAESHSHPTNKALHSFCVPLIVLSLIGFLWSIPVPAGVEATSPWLNWATLTALLAFVYYVTLSPGLSVGVALSLAAMFAIVAALDSLAWPLWLTSLILFVVAWIGQFIGHALEGKRPSFFKDLQFLMIGPLWLLAAVYRRLGVSY